MTESLTAEDAKVFETFLACCNSFGLGPQMRKWLILPHWQRAFERTNAGLAEHGPAWASPGGCHEARCTRSSCRVDRRCSLGFWSEVIVPRSKTDQSNPQRGITTFQGG